MCNDGDLEGWTYSSEVFINTSYEYAWNEADRRAQALRDEGLGVRVCATAGLGGLQRGFSIWYRKDESNV